MPVSEVHAGRRFGRLLRRRGPLGWLTRWLYSRAGLPFVNGPAMMLPDILELQAGHRLVDIGGGSGALVGLLESIVGFERPAICLDASADALRRGARGAAYGRVEGVASRLPLASSAFDIALLSHIVSLLDEEALELALREVRRILKPGGVCLLWDYAPRSSPVLNRWNQFVFSALDGRRPHLRSTWQLTSIASEGGFGRIRVLHLGPFYLPPVPRVSILLQKSERRGRRSLQR